MRIWTRATYQFDPSTDEYLLVPDESVRLEYEGPVALCKGDDTAKATEEQQQQLQQQQMQYSQQLMSIFSQQFANQSNVLKYIQGKMQPLIDNPQGYDQQTLTSMRTSADDNISTQAQDAQKALNATEFSTGSRDLPSGVTDQLDAGLLDSEAVAKSEAQNQITQADANLAEQNKWNAISTLSGVAAQDNPLGYSDASTGAANSATGAGNGVANLGNTYTSSQQSGLMGVLGGVAGGVFGAAGKAGGFTKLFG